MDGITMQQGLQVQVREHEGRVEGGITEPGAFGIEHDEALRADEPEVAPLAEAETRPPGVSILATPRPAPLAPWSRLWPVLRRALQAVTPGRDFGTAETTFLKAFAASA